MSRKNLEITELDEAGNLVATYRQSPGGKDGVSRVDWIVRPAIKTLPKDADIKISDLKSRSRHGSIYWMYSCRQAIHTA